MSTDETWYLKINNYVVTFVKRASDATRITVEKVNANVRFKVNNRYIRHSHYKLYLQPDNGTELFRKDSLWTLMPMTIDPEHTFVIARYKEPVQWTRFLPGTVILYEKSNVPCEFKDRQNITRKSLENVGREAHTYLWHIVNEYDNLTERVTFLQADPFTHSADLLELCSMSKDFLDVQSLSTWYVYTAELFRVHSVPSKALIDANIKNLNGAKYTFFPMDRYGRFQSWKDAVWDNKSKEYCRNLSPIDTFYTRAGLRRKIKNKYSMAIAALFSVTRERILSNSKQDYQNLMKELLHTTPQGGFEVYIMERIWCDIFRD